MRASRRLPEVPAALAAVGVLWGCGGSSLPEAPPTTNKPRDHVVVEFTDTSLHPSIARVLEGGTLSFVNYSVGHIGAIEFTRDTEVGFTCTDLAPRWKRASSGVRSEPITGVEDEFALPCPLKPGEYDYELLLFDAAGEGRRPPATLPGLRPLRAACRRYGFPSRQHT